MTTFTSEAVIVGHYYGYPVTQREDYAMRCLIYELEVALPDGQRARFSQTVTKEFMDLTYLGMRELLLMWFETRITDVHDAYRAYEEACDEEDGRLELVTEALRDLSLQMQMSPNSIRAFQNVLSGVTA